ncbi:hypothetical protein VB773_22210 [Haloarculaceae archaeon H-GB2-1]|nr:hypothetical protein [Haloarculaceae archaeon H-GB1-1]MEA5389531.1 hypothetical protein [Haloarculaceae archaeon H-GB11]MEA5410014.1 hypothetical protein [Haloarculaceae archaeon H-GB2-1]
MTSTPPPSTQSLDPVLLERAQRIFDRLDARLTLLDDEGAGSVEQTARPDAGLS